MENNKLDSVINFQAAYLFYRIKKRKVLIFMTLYTKSGNNLFFGKVLKCG